MCLWLKQIERMSETLAVSYTTSKVHPLNFLVSRKGRIVLPDLAPLWGKVRSASQFHGFT